MVLADQDFGMALISIFQVWPGLASVQRPKVSYISMASFGGKFLLETATQGAPVQKIIGRIEQPVLPEEVT